MRNRCFEFLNCSQVFVGKRFACVRIPQSSPQPARRRPRRIDRPTRRYLYDCAATPGLISRAAAAARVRDGDGLSCRISS